MKKKAILFIILLASIFIFKPENSYAASRIKVCTYENNISISIFDDYSAEGTISGSKKTIKNWNDMKDYVQKNNGVCPKYAMKLNDSLYVSSNTTSSEDFAQKNSTVVSKLKNESVPGGSGNSNSGGNGNSGHNNNQELGCTGDNSLLGDPDDPNSVAWLVQKALNYVKLAGPLLVLVFTCIDYLKALVQSDDDTMTKNNKKLVTRIMLALLLFFIPLLVNVVLEQFAYSTITCGLE